MKILFTVGASNLDPDKFIGHLKLAGVDQVIDVRSSPFSRWSCWANSEPISGLLNANEIGYLFLGSVLGGRQDDCITDGAVDFTKIAAKVTFQTGLESVKELCQNKSCCLMCAEGDPVKCHRLVLISRYLRSDLRIMHILRDGSVLGNGAAEGRMMRSLGIQPGLFGSEEGIERAYDEQGRRIAWRPK